MKGDSRSVFSYYLCRKESLLHTALLYAPRISKFSIKKYKKTLYKS